MNDSELKKLILKIEKNHKDLTTKYRVLVKRTDSIISSLNDLQPKIDSLINKLSVFEILSEDVEEQEEWNPYDSVEPEDYDNYDDEDEGKGYD